jgi:hypothetical protein
MSLLTLNERYGGSAELIHTFDGGRLEYWMIWNKTLTKRTSNSIACMGRSRASMP